MDNDSSERPQTANGSCFNRSPVNGDGGNGDGARFGYILIFLVRFCIFRSDMKDYEPVRAPSILTCRDGSIRIDRRRWESQLRRFWLPLISTFSRCRPRARLGPGPGQAQARPRPGPGRAQARPRLGPGVHICSVPICSVPIYRATIMGLREMTSTVCVWVIA